MTWTEKMLRSPFMSALCMLIVGYTFEAAVYPEHMPDWMVRFKYVPGVAFIIVWILVWAVHNLRHPDRKIRFFHYLPPEFREEDEGQAWTTYRACRTVYIFMYTAIPVAMLVMALARDVPYAPIAIMSLLGAMQCVLFWREMRKWARRDAER